VVARASESVQRVGILGGTFDPPHLGHLALARAAFDELGLDRLVVIPVGEAPHKPVETGPETRFRLAEAAFAGVPHTELSRVELDRAGPSYTAETAAWAERELGDDVVLLLGADEFADFPTWREPDLILDHVRLAVATRPGIPHDRLEAVRARLARPERVTFFELDPIPISSRDIRARVARGEAIDDLVPPGVGVVIEQEGLYGAGATL
jgi:nicotinate-nucleotide adenylyltransferase